MNDICLIETVDDQAKRTKQLIAEAMARYNALSPDEQQKMWEEQRRNWKRGEMALIPLDIAMGQR